MTGKRWKNSNYNRKNWLNINKSWLYNTFHTHTKHCFYNTLLSCQTRDGKFLEIFFLTRNFLESFSGLFFLRYDFLNAKSRINDILSFKNSPMYYIT